MAQENINRWTGRPGRHLMEELEWVHGAIRRDLATCKELAGQVASGAGAGHVEEEIRSLKNNSILWRLRVGCLTYCRFVHTHHRFEDVGIFPGLRRSSPELGPVVDRLEADHRRVSGRIEEVEAATRALVADDGARTRNRLVVALDDLGVDLLEHLKFEEDSIEPTVLGWDRWPW